MCNPNKVFLVCACLLAVWIIPPALGEVKLPAIISDNMVLQQSAEAAIWGWASPGEQVTVTLAGQKAAATADAKGDWSVRLATPKPGGPYELTVTGADNTITVKNVLVGQVWLCSGQSNMAFPLKASADAGAELPAARFPSIRLFTVAASFQDAPANDVAGEWRECEPNAAADFSAVAYYFGRDLHNILGVPVGLINSSVGGTKAELWTSKQAFETDPNLKEALEDHQRRADRFPSDQAKYEQDLAAWKDAAEKAKAEGKELPAQPRSPRTPHPLGSLLNGMIAPLTHYSIAGVIWYQGESDSGAWRLYPRLFPAMISDWRRYWGRADLPFLFVQLPNYRDRRPGPSDSNWARLREAQLMALAAPDTAMAVTIDIGDPNDVHPANKRDVGLRLSLAAQKIAYGRDVVWSGPICDSVKFEGSRAIVSFKHPGGGLVARGPALTGFALAGDDRRFVWAEARIEGPTVIVSSPDVPQPVALRYAWADNPECNLYNREGLPASPFRTDDWPKGRAASAPQ
jgi:sialate O-acetylesterase